MSGDFQVVPLWTRPLAEICAILNSGYEGYVVPVRFDEAALMRRVLAEHIDLSASGLLSAGKAGPAGILLVARRGRISRIAALGLRPAWRGAGLGGRAVRWAIDTARARGDSALILEVIEGNDPAVATYRKAGFTDRRRLVSYSHPGDEGRDAGAAQAVSPAEVLPLLLGAWPAGASWQTDPRCHAGAVAPVEAFTDAAGAAAALVDRTGPAARLLALAVRPEARRRGAGRALMRAAMAQTPGKPWTISATLPEGMAEGFLQATGWTRTPLRQIEMEHRLDGAAP
ncbi:GNAT family N-acetyltransferase [Fuscovulum blasticum]|uniref:GNAT family N-acetyltransferase n=1 Tax=Fuscovulum blasticum TaxID=1075 RepID=UPI000D3ED215|nr:GNAT family N-acetyltransferase [Fuscovulum blasticum]AWD22669.1 hypothetical protein B6K69_14135 [Fuscovulum blasticum]